MRMSVEFAYPVLLYRYEVHYRAELLDAGEECGKSKKSKACRIATGDAFEEDVEDDARCRDDGSLEDWPEN